MSDNTSNNNRIAKNTIVMYIRMFITMVVGLYTARVVLANLGFEDYGLNSVIGGIVAMFSIVSAGLYNAAMRFIAYYQGQNDFYKQKVVFSMTMFIHIILACFLILFGESIGLWYLHNKLVIPEGREFAAEWLYQLSVLTAAISLINVPYNASIIAHEKMTVFAYISIFDVLAKLIIVISLAWIPYDKLIFLASGYFVIVVLDFLLYCWYCRRNFAETSIIRVWDIHLFKEIFSFSGWGIVGSAAFLCNTQGINLMINAFFGTGINAARGIAVSVENVVKQFMSNVQTAINPQITKSYASGDIDRAFSLVFSSCRYCFYLMYLIVLPIILIAPIVLNLWLGEYPGHTVGFVRLILLNTILDSIINPLWTINNATGRVKVYQIVVNGVSLCFIPLMYLALKITLVPEVVFSILIINSLVGIMIRLIILRKNVGLDILQFTQKVICPIILVLGVSSIFPIIFFFILGSQTLIESLVIAAIAVISVLLTVYSIGISNKERKYILEKIKPILVKMR